MIKQMLMFGMYVLLGLSQPTNYTSPDSNSLSTTTEEIALIKNKVHKGKVERIINNTATRYTYNIPDGVLFQDINYEHAHISYIDFDDPKKQDRISTTLINKGFFTIDIIVAYDGYEGTGYNGVKNGVPEIGTNITVSYWTASEIKLRAESARSSDAKYVLGEYLTKADETIKNSFHTTIDQALY